MFHRVNTARLLSRGRQLLQDPIEAFRELGRDTLGGVRSQAARALRETADIDLQPCIRDAILYGTTPRPVDAGDQTQTIGPQTPRNIQEGEPNEFKAGFATLQIAPTVIYRPTRPELIHRMIIGHSNLLAQILLLGTQDTLLVPGPDFLANYLFFNEIDTDTTLVVPLGRIGALITPNNPLVGSSGAGIEWRICLQLSQALVSPC